MSAPVPSDLSSEPPSLWDGYAPLPGVFDELFTEDGKPRRHVLGFSASVTRVKREELGRRWDRAQRELRENGVTYNVYDDSRGAERPWQLDPVPLLITAKEWRRVERGLAQRAALLEQVLQDLYGPQRLVREGVLPPELLFANPGFLRPCYAGGRDRGDPPARFLHLYAADLLRAREGGFQVLGDRTQAPSGMGYALENRIVLSRAFPGVYRDGRVERLAPFFRALLDTIIQISPRPTDRPHAVLLTPGPYNETYFEHAYLARYLGLTLVEGGDLTVRNRKVYLKTLGGLQQVDVILRRLDDAFCDPLSLRSDSALGVAGLLSSVRAGNVALINGLGSGAVETPALLPFMPALCQRLLGEPLELPSVTTYWCGEPASLTYVCEHLSQLVIKPAYPRPGRLEVIFGDALTDAERQLLVAQLRESPREFVAQERAQLSTAPSWGEDGIKPRPVAIRSYAVTDNTGYRTMAGGLCRVARDLDKPRVSMQHGAGSKDTCVLSSGPVHQVSLLDAGSRRLELSRGGGDLPSRVADNLYWVGRYLERVEGTARLLRGLFSRLTDEHSAVDTPELPTLCHALAIHTELDTKIRFTPGDDGPDKLEEDLVSFMLNGNSPYSLLSSMSGVYRVAFTVRERMSGDTWRVLGQLRDDQLSLAESRDLGAADAIDFLNRIIVTLAAFSGLQMESLSRSYAYRFMDMGRRLERAQSTARLLWSTLVGVHHDESAVLAAVLGVLDNVITYRRRYRGVVQLAPVLDLLLIDEENPRSLAFQLAMLHDHVQHLPRSLARPFRTREEQIVLRALTNVRLAEIESLANTIKDRTRPELDAHLQQVMSALPEMSDALTQSYLAHATPQQALGVNERTELMEPPLADALRPEPEQKQHQGQGQHQEQEQEQEQEAPK